jgi:hypothetical protein
MNTSLASADSANVSDTTTPMTYLAQQPITSSDAINDGNWWQGPRILRGAIARVMRSIRSLGPYVAIELILPGGSIIALALWTYRHRRAARTSAKTVSSAVVPAVRGAQLRGITPCTQR